MTTHLLTRQRTTNAPARAGSPSLGSNSRYPMLRENSGCPILAAALSRPGWDRKHSPRFLAPLLASILLVLLALSARAQSPVVLDSVVAVVNSHAILSSDIDNEISLSVLDPARGGHEVLTRQHALEQLISRALIEQQIRREDAQSVEPSPKEVAARLAEIRKELPACVHQNCASDAGWKAFLAEHHLTAERVNTYLRYRLGILAFIEQRFRQGIHIPPEEIETYYNDTLVPQYGPGEAIPSLERVSPRIQEILLEQHVNLLFDEWLTNLRKQGDVEILAPSLQDPSLESPEDKSSAAKMPMAAEGNGSR